MKTKVFYVLLTVSLIFSCLISATLAAEFRVAGKKGAGNVTLYRNETTDNLYAVGNIISINGDVKKDLIVTGAAIDINGDIGDDLWAVGGTITISGNVKGNVRIAGGNIMIEGEVEEDLLIAGGSVSLARSALVKGDVVIAGGTVEIEGPIKGSLRLFTEEALINSKIDKWVRAEIGDELKLGSEAEIGGNLDYSAPREGKMVKGARILGKVSFGEKEKSPIAPDKSSKTLFGVLTIAFLFKLLILLVAVLILFVVLKETTQTTTRVALMKFWANLGIGFALLVLMPIVCVLLAITVVGFWLAMFLIVVYILMLILAVPMAHIIFGAWLVKVLEGKQEYSVGILAIIIGVLGLALLGLVPYIGWLFGFVFMLVGLGALYRLAYRKFIARKQPKPQTLPTI